MLAASEDHQYDVGYQVGCHQQGPPVGEDHGQAHVFGEEEGYDRYCGYSDREEPEDASAAFLLGVGLFAADLRVADLAFARIILFFLSSLLLLFYLLLFRALMVRVFVKV